MQMSRCKTVRLSPLMAVAVLAFAPLGAAQIVGGAWEMPYMLEGTGFDEEFGSSLTSLADIDNDGVMDFAAGTPLADVLGMADAGTVLVYSGATGSLLYRFDGAAAGNQFGFAVADAGDVDADGTTDIIIGAPYTKVGNFPGSGSAFVYSGATGSLLRTYLGDERYALLGFAVAGLGDVNGDGHSDVAVGEPWSEPQGFYRAGSAFIYDGVTGATLFESHAPMDGWYWASALANAGDVDGDGTNDLIVGGTFADVRPGGHDNSGLAIVYSGASGAQLLAIRGVEPMDMLGNAVAGVGDVDGDGLADVAVGAYLVKINNKPGAGSTYLISGTGALLVRFEGQRVWERNGWSVANAGDIDGDGVNDILSGAHTGDTDNGLPEGGKVYLYSGRTYETLHVFQGLATGDRLGYRVAGLGDLNGDGRPEMGMSAHTADVLGMVDAGRVFVYSFKPCIATSADEIQTVTGATVDVSLDFPVTEAGKSYTVLASATGIGPVTLGGVEIPLTGDALYQMCRAGNPPPFMQNSFGVLDAKGDALAAIVCPPGGMTPLIGRTLFLAGVSYTPPTLVRMSSVAAPIHIH